MKRLSALLWAASGCSMSTLPSTASSDQPPTNSTTTIRFFTDARLDLRVNVRRVVGQPSLLSVYHDAPQVDLTFSGAGALPLPGGGYRMVYQHYGGTNSPKETKGATCCLLAKSNDGVVWEAEVTTAALPSLPNRQFPNQVMPAPGALHSVFVDPNPAVAAKCPFRALIAKNSDPMEAMRSAVWCSTDGVHWAENTGLSWVLPGVGVPEPPSFAFWNEVSGRYGVSCRPMWGDRRVTYHETADWTANTTTPQELVFEPDDLDPPVADHYGMHVSALDPFGTVDNGGFVGLLYVFHTPPGAGQSGAPGVIGGCPQKYNGGRIDIQLTFSRNGRHWQRTLRDPFLPNTWGSVMSGVVTPTSVLRLDNGTTLIFASATRREHGDLATAFPADSSIVTLGLRPDGWVALESAGGVGYIGTRVLFLRSAAPITVNVDCRFGTVRAQLTDHTGAVLPGFAYSDNEPLSGDETGWAPRWQPTGRVNGNGGGRGGWVSTEGANQTLVRLELELHNARVYAVSGDFVVLQAVQVTDWLTDRAVPRVRPGF